MFVDTSEESNGFHGSTRESFEFRNESIRTEVSRAGLRIRRSAARGLLRGCVLALTMVTAAIGVPDAHAEDRNRAYSAEAPEDRDRSYDLFLPAAGDEFGALIIFIHSRFWRERQPDRLIEDGFARGLLKAGHAVAVLRHRLGASGRHPNGIRDVAEGVAALLARIDAGEFDPERVFLAGHSSGAQLALLLALDPRWLGSHGIDGNRFAGVIALSGIFDLTEGAAKSEEEEAFYAQAFATPADRKAASPIEFVNPDLPAILLMNAARDIPGGSARSLRFAEVLRERGQPAVEYFVANGRDYFSMLDLASAGAPRAIFELLSARPGAGVLPESWQVSATWRNPPFSTEGFYQEFPEMVETHTADAHFHNVVNHPFRSRPGQPDRLRFSRYDSIPLVSLLEAMTPAERGSGEWLELTNARGERAVFAMAQIRELAPWVVIGVDGEKNLFRATDLYHTRRRYSWRENKPRRIDMARPLGGFLFFPKGPPEPTDSSPLIGRYALTPDSFRLRTENPLRVLDDLPGATREILLGGHHCVSCHRFRGVGGSAFHLRAKDGAQVGGFALPLTRYPAKVWQRFVFEQAKVAEEVGATAVVFSPSEAKALFDLVVEERKARKIEPWRDPDRERPSE